jgi:hypothetical protein
MLRGPRGLSLVGGGVVEVSPPFDMGACSAVTADLPTFASPLYGAKKLPSSRDLRGGGANAFTPRLVPAYFSARAPEQESVLLTLSLTYT